MNQMSLPAESDGPVKSKQRATRSKNKAGFLKGRNRQWDDWDYPVWDGISSCTDEFGYVHGPTSTWKETKNCCDCTCDCG